MTSEEAEFVYKCTNYYNPEAEHSILWNDTYLAIEWPLIDDSVLISTKDKNGIEFKMHHFSSELISDKL